MSPSEGCGLQLQTEQAVFKNEGESVIFPVTLQRPGLEPLSQPPLPAPSYIPHFPSRQFDRDASKEGKKAPSPTKCLLLPYDAFFPASHSFLKGCVRSKPRLVIPSSQREKVTHAEVR